MTAVRLGTRPVYGSPSTGATLHSLAQRARRYRQAYGCPYDSSGHRAVLLDSKYYEVGLGFAISPNGIRLTQLFVDRR